MVQLKNIMYHPNAKNDLEEIIRYIFKSDETAAKSMLDNFDISISRLLETPLESTLPKNRILARLNYHILDVMGYSVLFTVKGDVLELKYIIHGWRQWDEIPILPFEGLISHEKVINSLKKRVFAIL